MHTYILRGKYSPEAFDGMLNDPSDRAPAAQALVEAIGGKMLGMYFSVSSNEIVALFTADAGQLAEAEMILMASKAFSEISTETLITTDQMFEAMRKGQRTRAAYQSANMDEIDRMLLDE